jgi:hypothetical protein
LKSAFLFTLFVLLGCSSNGTVSSNQVLDNVYISSGVEQFFLTDMPYWANFSIAGRCMRKTPIRYMNFENINKSYDLKYDQILHLQHMLNKKLFAYKSSTGQNSLSPKDISYIFHNVYQQVLGESYEFISPKFKNVSVVWVDPLLNDKKKLKRVLNRSDVLNGHPVLLSHCLSAYELEELSQSLNLESLGVKYLPAEFSTIYGEKVQKNPFFSFNISSLLQDKNITVFGTEETKELIGNYKFIKIK